MKHSQKHKQVQKIYTRYRWQCFLLGTDKLFSCMIFLSCFIFASNIMTSALTIMNEKCNENGWEILERYTKTRPKASGDIPVKIRSFNGLIKPRLLPSETIDIIDIIQTNMTNNTMYDEWKSKPDFGGLVFELLEDGEQRHIKESVEETEGHVFTLTDYSDDYAIDVPEYMLQYFATDDDSRQHPRCRKISWHKTLQPNCNNIHQVNLVDSDYSAKSRYLASGAWRDAFSVLNDKAVLKVAKLDHPYDFEMVEMIRIDAMVMSLMQRSNHVVDIYGHCGVSVFVDFIRGRDIEELVVNEEIGDETNIVPFSPTEKLKMAFEMAKALSELHGFKDGVIVHNDIQYCQYLLDKDDRVILSDFNRAEPLLWDEENQQYCKYESGWAFGNVRSPEEYRQDYLDEKIDIYSFGNAIFTLLTGKEPYEDYGNDEIHDLSVSGKLPEMDPEIRSNSFAEAALASIMDKCYEYIPEKRIDIFKIVSLLKDTVQLNDRLEAIEISDVSGNSTNGYNWTKDDYYLTYDYYGDEAKDDYDSYYTP